MSKWTVEANSDTIATIEHHYPVQFLPERTCRNVGDLSFGEFECSECGLSLDTGGDGCCTESTMMFFEGRKLVRTLDMPNYCPNCGAKVVG